MKLTDKQIDNIEKWIEALRSGKYSQGRCFLRRDNDYCCLGVATELHYGEDCWKLQWDNDAFIATTDPDIPSAMSIPDKNIKKQFALDFFDINYLTHLNDSKQKDFDFIADYIEDKLDSYLGDSV